MIKRKQRFSLRKNKIGAMSVLLGISFIGAVASGSDVKANEISEEKAPKLIEKEVVGKTTKQDIEKAQAKVDASKEAESLKNKAIENKTTEITNNDNEISKIKADIERDKDATDENINKAEKNVESATEELKNKNSELVKTNAEKEERESDLVLVKKDVADKTKDLESKQAKAKEIKDEIDGTENVTKKLESEKAKNEDIKKELETEKSNKVVAEKELEKAKEFDAKLADNTKKAEENLKAKQEELKAKTSDLEQAKKDELAKKAELDNLLMPYGRNVKYKIALDQRFVDKFKEYMDYTLNWEEKGITMKDMFAKRRELRDQLKAIEKEIKHEFLYNRYSHEDDYEIDLRNMSEEERLKMSQYGVYLLNQIRNQFGLEPLKVNKNSMQLAKEITETVVRDNHSGLNAGHYIKGISEVAAKHGLIREGNFYENLYNAGSTTFSDHKMSRNALYEHIYNSVMLFFYEGNITSGYGHAESLYKAHTPMGLGVAHFENVSDESNINRLPKEFIEKNKQYIEFDEFGNILKFKSMPIDVFNEFDKLVSKLPKQGIIKISYIKVEEEVAIPGRNEDGTFIYDDESKEAEERAKQNFIAKYSNESKDTVELPAVPDLDSFKKAYADAVKVRESKEQPVVDAKANVDSATKALNELKATEKQTEKATAKVQEVDAKINNLTTKADEQQKVVDQLELDNVKYVEKMTKLAADLDAAQKDVEERTKLLDRAKALQKDVEGEIATATAKISQLENEIEASKKALDKAKDNFAKIRKARLELDKNKEKLAKETAVKAELEKDLSTLKAELIAISKQLADDTKELERIQRQYKLENFKWAVLDDNNTIDPIEFDLEKYLKDEEEKKKKSEIRPEQPITPETPERPEEPTKPGASDKPELPNLPVKPEDKTPGSSNNQPDLQRTSVNSNGLKTLPNTGESQSGMATVAGLVALAVATRLRKKDKQN
ncbi:SEC10/PgrA surface exclusion domain-containing protein [uncultured Gemella sp.]|uniref:SEC10/PgrA surface exclusion domain-containing protein n=1 Tax=uncultured Gemella sp. TaxID=254352 RepID=UPI0025D6893B|nr:SEC10/PgrA surface exclusion domain-containing protein [uncultured Gemella sp.]